MFVRAATSYAVRPLFVVAAFSVQRWDCSTLAAPMYRFCDISATASLLVDKVALFSELRNKPSNSVFLRVFSVIRARRVIAVCLVVRALAERERLNHDRGFSSVAVLKFPFGR